MDKQRAEAQREKITDQIYELLRMVMPAGQLLSKEADDQVFKIHDSLSDALNIPRVKDDEQI